MLAPSGLWCKRPRALFRVTWTVTTGRSADAIPGTAVRPEDVGGCGCCSGDVAGMWLDIWRGRAGYSPQTGGKRCAPRHDVSGRLTEIPTNPSVVSGKRFAQGTSREQNMARVILDHHQLDDRRGWIADERLWFHEVFAETRLGWGGLLEVVSLITLVAISAMGWLGVVAVLLRSVVG